MFHIEQVANKDYFCCPQGYIGVLPQTGAAGICEVEGVNIPKSQLATMASQIGGTSVTSSSGTPVPTVTTSSKSSAATTGQGQASAATTAGQGQGTATQTSVPGGEPTSGTSSNFPLPTGAIAGIAVGAAAFLLLFALILWLHRRSSRKRLSQTVHDAPAESFNQEDFKTTRETQAKQVGVAQSNTPSSGFGYSAPHGAEVDAHSRAEMEAPADSWGYNAGGRVVY